MAVFNCRLTGFRANANTAPTKSAGAVPPRQSRVIHFFKLPIQTAQCSHLGTSVGRAGKEAAHST